MILSVTNNEADVPNAVVEVFAGPLNVQDAIGNPTVLQNTLVVTLAW